jgi:hypothetical protein
MSAHLNVEYELPANKSAAPYRHNFSRHRDCTTTYPATTTA